MDSDKQKRIRKLKYKSKYIELDLEETKEIFLKAKKEWVGAIQDYCKNNETESPLTADEGKKKEPSEQESAIFSSTQIKDLYRKIVTQTHPDKLRGESRKKIKEKQELYDIANRAKEEKNVDTMLKIAIELEIDISHLDMRCLDLLEKQLEEREQEILNMRKDIAWQWYYAGEFKRNFIISKICPKPNKGV